LAQPASVTVPPGVPATFSVLASGAQLSYQWLVDEVPVAGANGPSYTLANATLADTGSRIRVVVSNPGGSITSNAAFLVVSLVGAGTPTQIVMQPADVAVVAGAPATFTVDATGESLAYQWQRNGNDIPGATGTSYTLDSATMIDHGAEFRVVVSGAGGTVTSDPAALIVTPGDGPVVSILAPATSKLYKAGQVIKFKGAATDPQDGKLPAGAFSWRVDFHHEDHLHPFMPNTPGKKAGAFRVPREGEQSANVWYRIHLTVTDSSGLSSTTFRDVHPRTVNVTVNANHPGLVFRLDGPPVPAPMTFQAVVGMKRTLGADASQLVDGVSYTFEKWSQSRKPDFTFTVPAKDKTFEVVYA
jgi:hypothetical protein